MAAEDALAQLVWVRGANRPLRELTVDDVRARADELREATGFGPTARVAPVALAWRQLAVTMERGGRATVADVDPDALAELAPRLWIAMPGMLSG